MASDPFSAIAAYYDWEHERFLDDLPLYRGFAQHCGGPVLELACGTGRLLVPLAEAGVEIEGLDASEAMLAIARSRLSASRARHRARVYQADMVSFELPRRFAMAFVALDSFGLLARREDQAAALRQTWRHLLEGGLFIVDVANGNTRAGLATQELRHVLTAPYPPGGGWLTKLVAVETDLGEQVDRYTYFYDETLPSGKVRRTIASLAIRYFGRFELELLLEQAGFRLETLYGSWELEPYGAASERLIAVARRP